jgi:AcrR family transcriptional regulator
MDSKDKIMKNALKIFIEKGYDNTSMSYLAKKSNLSKAGLYHHYSCKKDLLFTIIDYMLEKKFAPILKKTEKISNPKERLTYFVRNYIKLLTENASPQVVIHESKRLRPHQYKKVRLMYKKTYDVVKSAIVEMNASHSGKGKVLNEAFVAFALLGMSNWVFYWFDYSRKESAEELADTFIEIFFKGYER